MISKKSKLLYPLRVLSQFGRLPHYIDFFESRNKQLSLDTESIQQDVTEIKEVLKELQGTTSVLRGLDSRLVDLQHKIETQKSGLGRQAVAQQTEIVNNTVADNHDFDYFYKLFEDKFRGDEDTIKKRVAEHLPLFQNLSKDLKKLPVIDLGCGRGEFLSVLKDNKVKAIGVDMNKSMVERAKTLGYDAVEDDALSYLSKQKTASLAAVTGFHIVEHIPFETLLKTFEQCYRTVASGGIVLFETPNPQNLTVGACNFYMDPSHISPIPPDLLAFALESVGFKSEILPLHPAKDSIDHPDPVVKDMMNMLYGPIDYAVIARKI